MKNIVALIFIALVATTAGAQIGSQLKDLRSVGESVKSISQGKGNEKPAVVSVEEKEMDDRLQSLFGEYQSYKAFFYEFQKNIGINDKNQVSRLISYPIDIAGKKISDASQFLEI